ncbi:hypothetical protein FHETE_3772 [Fusarium heterosporum]|uniref:Uncharacterized protein n=1 Tax=Fusarium heterosporum TaxID=42747 RepID=A0A8H5WW71_FUSHE|nr:hypothetical protein FHETE_3772 [Fusarium heterosporum]
MDFFSRLPSLVQSDIIIRLESEADIMSLIQASPAMLSHFTAYRLSILRAILNNLLANDKAGDMIRDALGIVFISNASKARLYHNDGLWNTLELCQHNIDDLRRLHRLFSRMITFIEDYITKATNKFPPRAYMGLPDLKTGTGSYFKGRPVNTDPVRFTTLTSSERQRLLACFLRYELLSKIHHPQVWTIRERIKLYNKIAQSYGLSRLSNLELPSVHEYYRGLYGAIFAHCQDSWLPDQPGICHKGMMRNDGPSDDCRLLFPDNLFFDARAYLAELNIKKIFNLDVLPSLGLDLITTLVIFLNKDPGNSQHVRKWLRTFLTSTGVEYYPWIDDSCFYLQSYKEGYLHDNSLSNLNNRPKGFITLQHQIWKQRAWGLLDDSRLWPEMTSHFPTVHRLRKLDEGLIMDHARRERRSQKWQDYYAGKRLNAPRHQRDEETDQDVPQEYTGFVTRFFDKVPGAGLPTAWNIDSEDQQDM